MHVLLYAVLVRLLQRELLTMVDLARAHEAVWRAMGAQVEDGSVTAVAPDCLFVLPGGTVRGLDNARPYFAAYLGAYPDTVKDVQYELRDERAIVIRSVVTGHNSGELVTPGGTAGPSGAEVAWDVVEWLVVEDGQIVEWRVYQDPTPYIDALNALQRTTAAERALGGGGGGVRQACVADTVAQVRLASPLEREPSAASTLDG